MANAQVGDLIRITNAADGEPYKNGEIYEVISIEDVFNRRDANVYIKYGDGGELPVCYDEYEVFRKAGEEDADAIADISQAETSQDAVNPQHYKQGRIEVIDVIEDAVAGADAFEAVCQANVLKYMLRYRHKNGVVDIKKAVWYMERLVTYLDAKTTE